MAEAQSQHRIGIALVISAAVAWSTAPFFTRLLPFDSWTILFWRGLFGCGLIAALAAARRGQAGLREFVRVGPHGWLVAGLSTLGMVCFIPALQMTSVANVAVINAAFPFVAAGLAWIWLREAVQRRTLLASLAALIGVAILAGDVQAGADLRGIGLATLMVLAIGAMTVAVRQHKETPMVAAAALSNLLGSVVSIPFAHGILNVTGMDLLVLAAFGCFQVALGLTLFVLGSRLLPSGQAALIATLETPLMPFWVWVAFHEVPSRRALIGGALVMSAVIFEIIGENLASAKTTTTDHV